MKTQLAFFDIDGTLSAPYYPVGPDGTLRAGMTDEQWIEFCRTWGEDSYRFCKPVLPVIRYAKELLAAGAELYVLSTSQTEEEDRSKEKFIKRHCAGLFKSVLTVRDDTEKVQRILAMASEGDVAPEACELVEDTYALVLDAINHGVKGTHIAQIVWDL